MNVKIGKKYLTKFKNNHTIWFYFEVIEEDKLIILDSHSNYTSFHRLPVIVTESFDFDQPTMEIKRGTDYKKIMIADLL